MAEYTNAAFEQKPKRRIWLRWASGAVVLLVVLGVAYSAYWSAASDTARAAIDDWIKAQQESGLIIKQGAIEVAGFPLSIRFTFDNLSIRATDSPRWAWAAERIVASARPWSPLNVEIDLGQSHQFSFETEEAIHATREPADMMRDVNVTANLATLILKFGASIDFFSLSAHDARVDVEDVSGSGGASLIDLVYDRHRNPEGPTVSFFARDLALPLPALENLGLGTVFDEFGADITITGPLLPGPIDESVAAWRDGGGALELKRIRLRWGDLIADADGAIALDETMRPIGALTAHVLGLSKTISQLADAGVLSPKEAAIARITISLLSKTSRSGRVDLPISAQFGKLYLGAVPVAEIPPLQLRPGRPLRVPN
jgi:hypothetical protein